MNIFLYSSNSLRQEIERTIQIAIPKVSLRSCSGFAQFRESLRSYPAFSNVIVLAPSNRDDLSNILTLTDWLVDYPLILIFPDCAKETISDGLKLMPRFYTFADSNLQQMVLVLLRLLNKEKEKQRMWTEARFAGTGLAK